MYMIDFDRPLHTMDKQVFIQLMQHHVQGGAKLFLANKPYYFKDADGVTREVRFKQDVVKRPSEKGKQPDNLWRYDVVGGTIMVQGGQASIRSIKYTLRIDHDTLVYKKNHPRVAKVFQLPNSEQYGKKRSDIVRHSLKEREMLHDLGEFHAKELVGEDDEQVLVMHRLAGQDLLQEFICISRRPFEQRLQLFIDIVRAVRNQLHDRQDPIIHRDLKPDNLFREVMVQDSQDSSVIRVLDVGLAIYAKNSKNPEFLGTVLWAAPEQISAQLNAPATLATDAFSIGRMGGYLMGDTAGNKYNLPEMPERDLCHFLNECYKEQTFEGLFHHIPDIEPRAKALILEVVSGLQAYQPSDRMSLIDAENKLMQAQQYIQSSQDTPAAVAQTANAMASEEPLPATTSEKPKKSSPRRLLHRALAKLSFHNQSKDSREPSSSSLGRAQHSPKKQ